MTGTLKIWDIMDRGEIEVPTLLVGGGELARSDQISCHYSDPTI